MKKILLALAGFQLLSSCAPFVDSPFSDQLLRPERGLNALATSRIANVGADSVLRIAVFSDSHQNYKELDKATYAINQTKDIDFVANLGDFTNSGYNLEYDQFIDAVEHIKPPTIMALGNHDAIGAGPQLFRKAFGPTNFYFESDGYRFIFFNSNNLETPDDFKPAWLKDAVTSSTLPVLIFSHVQLRDPDRFFDTDAALLNDVITNSKVKVIFNGHNHVYNLIMDNGTVMMQCGRVEAPGNAHWLLVEITGNNFCVKRMDTKESTCETLKP
ncbi:metallophosphoesterase [Bdellovibrio bacteriovorus]|uniref:metallophosphoesterase family protein n=1 Tax=Bdellovibrio bacteriovorus TaxID=959 RepID=UPI0021D1D53B|nr:metallophosphoesterase [Bdellovibrio bacteriovorus]UXR66075.1 metallophosphoesterase [Bdellovibrio bacteriovorus]